MNFNHDIAKIRNSDGKKKNASDQNASDQNTLIKQNSSTKIIHHDRKHLRQ